MSWIARLVNVFRAEKVSEDIDRELAFHLAERTDALIADGASPEAARREARRRFGNYTGQRENTPRSRFARLAGELWRRRALRASWANQESDFRGHVHPHAGNRNRGQHYSLHATPRSDAAPPACRRTIRAGARRCRPARSAGPLRRPGVRNGRRAACRAADARRHLGVAELACRDRERDGTLRYVQGVLVTGNAFDLLGLRPRIGRLIDTADDVRGGPSEGWPVVLSDIFWRDNFGRDPNIIGNPLRDCRERLHGSRGHAVVVSRSLARRRAEPICAAAVPERPGRPRRY